jgi:hypothetical protein
MSSRWNRSAREEILTQRWLVRPAMVVWMLLAVVMLLIVSLEIALPPVESPATRLFPHRENVGSEEHKAVVAATSALSSARLVFVDTDNRFFFGLLRYRLYPCWAVSERELKVWQHGGPDFADVIVRYRDGLLSIEPGEVR